jgi:hypothetical protein
MRRILAAVAVLTLTACITDSVGIVGTKVTGGDSSPASTSGVGGTYTLRTVAGAPLPYTYAQSGADKSEFLDDVITLTDNGTWSELMHIRTTLSGVATVDAVTDAGTYVREGTTGLTFSTPKHPDFSGVWSSGNTLTLFGPSPSGQLVSQVFTK